MTRPGKKSSAKVRIEPWYAAVKTDATPLGQRGSYRTKKLWTTMASGAERDLVSVSSPCRLHFARLKLNSEKVDFLLLLLLLLAV